MIEVSDVWLERLQRVLPAAIDALKGLDHQIDRAVISGDADAADLLRQLKSQMIDLRRSIEAVLIIF